MARADQRRAALRLCLVTLGLALLAFVWTATLTFSPFDPPYASAWRPGDAFANWCGPVGAWAAGMLLRYLGVGAYVLVGILSIGLAATARGARFPDAWLRAVGLALLVVVVSAIGALLPPAALLVDRFPATGPGGVLGVAAAHLMHANFDTGFTVILLACGVLVGLLLAADEFFFGMSRGIGIVGRQTGPVLARGGAALAHAGAVVAAGVSARLAPRGAPAPRATTRVPGGSRRPATSTFDFADDAAAPERADGAFSRTGEGDPDGDDTDLDAVESAPDDQACADAEASDDGAMDAAPEGDEDSEEPGSSDQPVVTQVGAASPRPRPTRTPATAAASGYRLPSIALLGDAEPVDRHSIEILCREKAYILEQTLNEFRLEVKVVAIETGPVITVFELKLSPGIKVSQIASLTNDMARALRAPAVRVVAPLPGKNTIGIEVPNIDKEKVRLKDLLLSVSGRLDQYAVPLFLGKDASGAALVSDLTRMPHLLIAGTTGSGKSVCVSSIIMSILLTRTPDDVNMILVDPKVVELAMFKDIPHLMCPIVTETSKAEGILDWAATKMDERYALLAEAGVKEIRAYNRLGEAELRQRMQIESDEEMGSVPVRLPYIVIVIDELADLMMTSAKEVEFFLCRLAQKSRAVGIHLIVSTQRPQANVVTGLIKSNLPCRIAFRVSSRLDSRIVLDQNGGEVLMGQGDMLFLPPGSSKLVRAQGTYVSDDELRSVVQHVRSQGEPNFHPELTRLPRSGGEGGGERDELFDEAVDIILESGRGSVSLLQRRLTIGYGRASRLIDQMYEAGIVGEYKGSQAREIIMSREEWQNLRAMRDREEAAGTT